MKSDEPEHMNGEENQSNQTHMKTWAHARTWKHGHRHEQVKAQTRKSEIPEHEREREPKLPHNHQEAQICVQLPKPPHEHDKPGQSQKPEKAQTLRANYPNMN
jgi:hypothetical protein